MSTNYHTPWQDGVSQYKASDMNTPLGELDEAIGDLQGLGEGKISAPATNTDNNVPQWDGTNTGELKNGLGVVTTVGNPGTDTNLPTEKAVRDVIGGHTHTESDITNIGAHNHNDEHYTKTELNTSAGGGAVHWDNVTDKPSVGSGDGDVVGPATNTDNNIPQWNGANSNELKDGLTLATSIGTPGVDTAVASEKAVRDAIAGFGTGSGDVVGPATHSASYVPQWGDANSKTLLEGFAITEAGKAILDDADAAAQRTTLGVDSVGIGTSYFPGDKPENGDIINVLIPFGLSFTENLVGSLYYAATGPASEAVVSICKNGTQFATLTVAIGQTTGGTWAGSATAFAAGDRLSFEFPATADANWAGVAITIKGVRS